MIKRIGEVKGLIAEAVNSFSDSVEEFWGTARQSVVSLARRVWAGLLQGMKSVTGLAQRVWGVIVRMLKLVGNLAKRVWNAIARWLSSVAGAGLLLAGVLIGFVGFSKLYPGNWVLGPVIEEFYTNASTELISIAITVLIIDSLNKFRQDQQLKEQLIRDMGGAVNDFSLRAARELA